MKGTFKQTDYSILMAKKEFGCVVLKLDAKFDTTEKETRRTFELSILANGKIFKTIPDIGNLEFAKHLFKSYVSKFETRMAQA